jgi:hypothetical protein
MSASFALPQPSPFEQVEGAAATPRAFESFRPFDPCQAFYRFAFASFFPGTPSMPLTLHDQRGNRRIPLNARRANPRTLARLAGPGWAGIHTPILPDSGAN